MADACKALVPVEPKQNLELKNFLAQSLDSQGVKLDEHWMDIIDKAGDGFIEWVTTDFGKNYYLQLRGIDQLDPLHYKEYFYGNHSLDLKRLTIYKKTSPYKAEYTSVIETSLNSKIEKYIAPQIQKELFKLFLMWTFTPEGKYILFGENDPFDHIDDTGVLYFYEGKLLDNELEIHNAFERCEDCGVARACTEYVLTNGGMNICYYCEQLRNGCGDVSRCGSMDGCEECDIYRMLKGEVYK